MLSFARDSANLYKKGKIYVTINNFVSIFQIIIIYTMVVRLPSHRASRVHLEYQSHVEELELSTGGPLFLQFSSPGHCRSAPVHYSVLVNVEWI